MQYTPTQFLHNLRHNQIELYVRFRANIPTHMDTNAKDRLKNFIDREQTKICNENPDLTRQTLFLYANRIKWVDIKKYIMTLCKTPLPVDRFIEIRKLMRKDDSTVVTWAGEVKDLIDDVSKLGGHWKVEAKKEAVPTITNFMTKHEIRAFEDQVVRENVQQEYPTLTDIDNKMDVPEFVDICEKIHQYYGMYVC